MSEHIDAIKARIKELEAKKKIELSSEDVSERYVEDLNDSIRGCKTELKFLEKHPEGVQMVNGG